VFLKLIFEMAQGKNEKKNSAMTATSSLLPVASLQAGTSLDATEQVFTVTPENIPTPGGHLRKEMRLRNLWHRATFIVVQYNGPRSVQELNNANNNEQRYLVQKRSQFKDFGPGLLDGSPGGVLGFGESYLENAAREIQEEMGIDITERNTFGNRIERLFAFSYQDERVRVFGECFQATYNGPLEDLKLQETEVDSVMVMLQSELIERMEKAPDDFLPDSLCAMKLYFQKEKKVDDEL
jgi:8-oxo-dGTP pyrophosphatase MutT (NUDIX family)